MTQPISPKPKAAPDLRLIALALLALIAVAAVVIILSRRAEPAPAPAPTATAGFEANEFATALPAGGARRTATPTVRRAATATATPTPTARRAATATPTTRRAATATPTTRRAATATPTPSARRTATATPADRLPTISAGKLPSEARTTLRLIDAGGPFPYRQDDAVFGNREGLLPKRASGYYREYTVVTPGSPDRGARRIIAGDGGERYYTDDHYASFRRVIP